MGNLIKLLNEAHPIRTILQEAAKRLNLGSYEHRIALGAIERPHYAYGVYNAGYLAKKLGLARVSLLEFGVAGGNGLLNLEYHAKEVSKLLGVVFEIYGFDTGAGLPTPVDYRDLPYSWKEGFFRMDVPALRAKLTQSVLVLGEIKETTKSFFEEHRPAPIGFVSFDVDFYSSTVSALELFHSKREDYLPRVICYFDDTIGTEIELYSDFTGQRLAIHEFNDTHEKIKLSKAYNLLSKKITEPWFHQSWVCHFLDHPNYNKFVGREDQQLAIKPN